MEMEMAGEKRLPVTKGQTILEASLEAGIPHFHSCGGKGECSTCRVLVLEGEDRLSPINEKEAALRATYPLPSTVRLACQAMVLGADVRVKRIILDRSDVSVYIKRHLRKAHVPVGEKKELALFFLDIRNFTPFVENYLAFDVIHVIRSFYIIFSQVVERYHGRIVDTTGDGFYACFGLQEDLRAACDHSIETGYEIMREVVRFNETYLKPYFNTRFELGIGIHCGEAIVGELKLGQQCSMCVMGMAVNVASRIQALTKKLNNSFIASDDLIVRSSFHEEKQVRLVKLKGVSEAMRVHLLGDEYEIAGPLAG